MTIDRVFLNWDRPGLVTAADYLVKRYGLSGTLDLHSALVVAPGARAGRRLLEILVDRAERQKQALIPPEILTIGRLPERLYTAHRPFADELVQQLAWADALRGCERSQLEHLTPAIPGEHDHAGWRALGEILAALHRELAAEGLDFAAVADQAMALEGFDEQQRWRALAVIQQGYLRTLDKLDLWDLQTARLHAIRHTECRTDGEIVLVGTVDMNRSQKLMLDLVAGTVTALVIAPADMADRFDGHGCLQPEAWRNMAIDLADDQIGIVDSPLDQATATANAIASLEGRYTAGQLTIGVPDQRIVPYLEQVFRQCNVPVRYGVGGPVLRSPPCRLLEVVRDYLDDRSPSAFAALIRHPAVQRWLQSAGVNGDWLSEMDRYCSERLPHRLGESWGGRTNCATLRAVYQKTEVLLDDLGGGPRPLDQWAGPIVDMLVEVFGISPLDRDDPADTKVLAACELIHRAAREYLSIPQPLMPSFSGVDALRLVLRQIEAGRIEPPTDAQAIELLGWLELAHDDAPALVVTGLNEGIVPASVNADPFLPNRLRSALRIMDNDRRYTRDAYILAVLAASRKHLKLIAGRRTAAGDPLQPSRLLFACDQETVAKRVNRFFSTAGPPSATVPQPSAAHSGPGASPLDIPQPKPLAAPVTSMRVTEFRAYLSCPYRYYLRHRLGLEGLTDATEELDGAAFGQLAHTVLGGFGKGPAALSTNADEIRAALDQLLDGEAARRFGTDPRAVVRVQLEQLSRRLQAFSQWQAEWASQGWRIEYTETGPDDEAAPLTVDGEPMYLRGRIDRIDVHESTHGRILFDYKTADTAQTPDKTHRQGNQWIDLQLPLYRHLVAGLGIEGPVRLAYIALPKDANQVDFLEAKWTDGDLREADRAAEGVVRAVRHERFWPPADPPPAFAEEFAAICQDDRFGGLVASADAQSGDAP